MRSNEKYFRLFANCIPVKGVKRSLLCDLQRNDVKLIPNDLYVILTEYEGKTTEEIKAIYEHKYDAVIDEYFEFLIEEEYIFFTNTPELFPKMNMQFHDPFVISNSIMDRNKQSEYDIYNVLRQLALLKCKFLELRFFDTVPFSEIEALLHYLHTTKSIIVSVGILIPFFTAPESLPDDLLTKFPRLSYLIFHSAEHEKFIPPVNGSGYIIHTKNKMLDERCCGVISTSYFISNVQSFTEALKHNSCLHRKIAIDTHGNIKNCPSMTQSFGNIKDTTLAEALTHKDFKKYWNITKDQLAICKDCEFRYICTDCRAYVDHPGDPYAKPLIPVTF